MRGVAKLAPLEELLDAAFCGFQLTVAVPRKCHTALEERERSVEREVASLELSDDALEFGDGGFKVLD
jgi:exonuclease VII small subunit